MKERDGAQVQEQTGEAQANQQPAQEPAAEPAGQQPAKSPAPPAPTLAQEAEAFCADLERFFRRAFGDLPETADLSELHAEQATIRDMMRRATEAGGENSAKFTALASERDKLKATVAQRDAALLQKKADFLNYQARTSKDLTRAEELALRRYMLDLLPVLDSLKLSLRDAASPAVDVQRLKDALGLIDTSLNQALAVRGLQRILVEAGKPFDPNVHEAVALRPAEPAKGEMSRVWHTFGEDVALRPAEPAKGERPNTVLEELRAGYLWKGLLLRPAQVLISGPEKQAKEAPAAG